MPFRPQIFDYLAREYANSAIWSAMVLQIILTITFNSLLPKKSRINRMLRDSTFRIYVYCFDD